MGAAKAAITRSAIKTFLLSFIILPPFVSGDAVPGLYWLQTSLPHEAGAFLIECPAGDEVLHGCGVVPGSETMFEVQFVGCPDGVHVRLGCRQGQVFRESR